MTEPKFTPGPWIAYPDDQGGVGQGAYVLVDDGASPIAQVMCYTPRSLNRKPYEANAHLIAAAPDMYSRHEEDIRILGYLLNELTGRVEAGKLAALEKMHDSKVALLAKARGKQ